MIEPGIVIGHGVNHHRDPFDDKRDIGKRLVAVKLDRLEPSAMDGTDHVVAVFVAEHADTNDLWRERPPDEIGSAGVDPAGARRKQKSDRVRTQSGGKQRILFACYPADLDEHARRLQKRHGSKRDRCQVPSAACRMADRCHLLDEFGGFRGANQSFPHQDGVVPRVGHALGVRGGANGRFCDRHAVRRNLSPNSF